MIFTGDLCGVSWAEEETETQRGCNLVRGYTAGERQSGLLNLECTLTPFHWVCQAWSDGILTLQRPSHSCVSISRLTDAKGAARQGCQPATREAVRLFLYSPACL